MYGIADLKPTIVITDTTVECPCNGCGIVVERARRGEPLRQQKFLCPEHRIYISPSTFEYDNELDNLLWRDGDDVALLDGIKRVKRESRLARDNSEDAVTWNVFRFLERTNSLAQEMSAMTGLAVQNPTISYWSYSSAAGGTNTMLLRARDEFGERADRGSEPDVIIEGDGIIVWIEAKLGSANETVPSTPSDTKKYLTGGDSWFTEAFVDDFNAIAVTAKRYELMRLWLLGTWAAARAGKAFALVNLVRKAAVEENFRRHVRDVRNATFVVANWEQVYDSLRGSPSPDAEKVRIYTREKGGGYVGGKLVPAFSSELTRPE